MSTQGTILLICVLLSLALVSGGLAQDTPLLEPQTVQITAGDGLMLVGDFYALSEEQISEEGAPAVVLFHDRRSTRDMWTPLVGPLVDGGYHVLTVDIRGKGVTGGDEDWLAALGDVQTWLDWLKTQPGVRADALSTGGAAIGGHLALIGCHHDEACVSAFAIAPPCVQSTDPACLSVFEEVPGLQELGEMSAEAVNDVLRNFPILLVSVRGEPAFDGSVQTLVSLSLGEISVWLYTRSRQSVSELLMDEQLVSNVLTLLESRRPT